MKNFYIAATREENDKYYSYVIRVSTSDNLTAKLADTVCANIYQTKKQAELVVNHWNACHKANGQYLFDE